MSKSLLIDTPGVRLRVEGERIVLFSSGKRIEIPLDEIYDICLCEGGSITTDLIARAALRGIVIMVVSRRGEPLAVLMPAGYGGTARTRREQILAHQDDRGLLLAKAFVKGGIIGRAKVLGRLARNRSGEEKRMLLDTRAEILSYLEELLKISGSLESLRSRIMGVEGRVSQLYFLALASVIPRFYGFLGERKRRPPGDPFNAAISFANSKVYREALRSVMLAGLDPYSGFLHADRPGRASMAIDLAEEFIPYCSHGTIIPLFTKKQLKKEDFEQRGGGFYLRGRGRRLVIERLETTMEKPSRYRNEVRKIKDIMLMQARAVASYVRGERDLYEPFVLRG